MTRLESFDGVSIAYGLAGPDDGGSAVLLHHGFASTAYVNWVRPGLVTALADAGRRVVALDARGHGAADHPHDPAAYAGAAMARDVTVLIGHLGLICIDMAGYSMGAIVAIKAALSDERVRSIFLGGVGTAQLAGRESVSARAVAEALEAPDAAAVKDGAARSFRHFAEATKQDRLALAAVQRAGRALSLDEVGALRVPTVVVNGERDTLAEDPFSIAKLIEGARAFVVPGDHLSAVLSAEFRDILVSWANLRGGAP
jgi:pimeloyl-ACP methyl ester carboxylesterase